VLAGPSGSGKSTVLKMIYGNYKTESGSIAIRSENGVVDIARAAPRDVLKVRNRTVGYVSQFLRVIPRVPTLDIVAEPLKARGVSTEEARGRAEAMLDFLSISPRLWNLSPTTFSGGEQQRVNIARGFIAQYPVMILDEPTASLDRENRQKVIALIQQAKQQNTALIGIFHNEEDRRDIATRTIYM